VKLSCTGPYTWKPQFIEAESDEGDQGSGRQRAQQPAAGVSRGRWGRRRRQKHRDLNTRGGARAGDEPDDNAPKATEANDDLEGGGHNERALCAPHDAHEFLQPAKRLVGEPGRQCPLEVGTGSGHLVGIGNAAVAAGEDDGDGGRDEGVGATHDGWEARAEEALDQRVDPGHEQQRLHHPRFLLLRAREKKKKRKAASFRVRLRAPAADARTHTRIERD
jgi:hypothetical protein